MALSTLLQAALPHHPLSRVVLRLTRVRNPVFKNALIRAFVAGYKPEMGDAERSDPLSYASFNDFFTRALKPGARVIAPGNDELASPVDGTLSQAGPIASGRLLQAKGIYYDLDTLLAGAAAEWAPRFAEGSFSTIYLAPYNYHRIHMPCAGELREAWYVPGRLFSVNAAAVASIKGLFARNERVVLLFEGEMGPFAVILVGAFFVGSMSTVWHGDVAPRAPRRMTRIPVPPQCTHPLYLSKGAEVGRFNMGSTVILLFGPGVAELERIDSGATLRLGQRLGRLGTARP